MVYDKKLTIGLFGFGVVGEGIYKVLQQTPTLNAEIKKICIKHADKQRNAPYELFTKNASEILNDEKINVVVELIDDAEAAYFIVKEALKNGKAVVSANKKMIAQHLDELIKLQHENEVPFLYEAAVCGSVPVIRNLEEYYDNDLLHSFSGIVNGSTNYILTKINENGLAYAEALIEAQKLGFAESDPALDVEGKDAVNKLAIVLKHAYGILTSPEEILHRGITQLHPADAKYAFEKGYRLKLVANAKRIEDDKVVAWVLPQFVQQNSQLFNVRNEFNGVLLGSSLSDEQFLYGKGAGRYPTSSAVLSDISALRYNYKYEYKKTQTGISYALHSEYALKVYVSFGSKNDIDENDFREIEETFTGKERSYLVGTIALEKLQISEWIKNENVSLVVFE